MEDRILIGHGRAFAHFLMMNEDTIPTNLLQYVSLYHLREQYGFGYKLAQTLNVNKKYLNLGTGCGFLEHASRERGVVMRTAERVFDPSDMILKGFDWWNRKLDVEVEYHMSGYEEQLFKIDGPTDWFNEAIATRFGPFQKGWITGLPEFIKELSGYTDHLRIFDFEVDPAVWDYFHNNHEVTYLNNAKQVCRIKLT